jgi:hypothetical protein
MEKVKVQICLDLDSYRWLTEEMIGRHHKNLSQTMRELLKNYQIMIRSVEKAQLHAEKTEKARYEAEQLAKSYRSAVVVTDAKA